MKCCWRSIYGIIIGGLKILLLIGVIIFLSNYVEKLRYMESKSVPERNETALKSIAAEIRSVIGVILLCVALIIICGLLIVGIVMRRHKLMLPWALLSSLGLTISCLSLISMTFTDFFSGTSLSEVGSNFFVGFYGIVFAVVILTPAFKVYLEIKSDEIEKNNKN